MYYFIPTVFLFSLLFADCSLPINSLQTSVRQVNNHWYCIYCGFKNNDKDARCKNWQCPTNQSIE